MKIDINLADAGHEGRHLSDPYGEITVTLSRRNLLALLHKLDCDKSLRTIQKYQHTGVCVTVIAEDDIDHYGDDNPGIMCPETEQFIKWNTIRTYEGSE